jgi:hypothetical protein
MLKKNKDDEVFLKMTQLFQMGTDLLISLPRVKTGNRFFLILGADLQAKKQVYFNVVKGRSPERRREVNYG